MAKARSEIQAKYDKAHCKYFSLKMHLENDADVIEKFASVPSMQGYIKQLVRDDIARTRPGSVPKKHMSLDDLYIFLQDHTDDYDGSMYELLNALTQKLLN